MLPQLVFSMHSCLNSFLHYSPHFVPLGSNTITKRTIKHPYRTRSKSRAMGEVEEVQEKMKSDMSTLKDQMASLMEAMLSMKRLIESNAAMVVAASTVVEADPALSSVVNLAHKLAPHMMGRGGEILGNTNSPRQRYNRHAYPYGLKSVKGTRKKEEPHVCMQSVDKESLAKPKSLVIHFTRDATS